MCVKCIPSIPREQWPKHKVPIPLERKQAELRDRFAVRKIIDPEKFSDPAIRSARLNSIRKTLKLTIPEYGYLLGVSALRIEHLLYDNRRPTMTILLLAEKELRLFQMRKVTRELRERARIEASIGPLEALPDIPTDDKVLKIKIMTRSARGKTRDQIARELVLRPELVDAYLKLLD